MDFYFIDKLISLLQHDYDKKYCFHFTTPWSMLWSCENIFSSFWYYAHYAAVILRKNYYFSFQYSVRYTMTKGKIYSILTEPQLWLHSIMKKIFFFFFHFLLTTPWSRQKTAIFRFIITFIIHTSSYIILHLLPTLTASLTSWRKISKHCPGKSMRNSKSFLHQEF